MGRIPSLHILESDLITLLEEIDDSFKDVGEHELYSFKEVARRLCERGKSYTCNARGVYASNDKVEKKVIKMQLATRNDASIFAQLLLLIRRQMKHRGITLIQPGQAEWFNLKEICKLATEFCQEFQIGIKEGYKEYLKIGLGKMKNFSLNKFKSIHSAICNHYEAMQVIEQDPTPIETKTCHDIYMGIISDKIGFSHGYEDAPEKYKHFVEAKQEAKKYGVSLKVYIKSQFEGFEWNNSVPDPTQLTGSKSIDRLQKYAFQNNIQLGKRSTVVDFKKIKHGRDSSK